MSKLYFEKALLSSGWAANVALEIDASGTIEAVTPDAPGAAGQAKGIALPGVPNVHSHAFQRAMAGLAEQADPAGDSFWTWREVMYRFANRIGPEDLEAIAAQLYVEMLKGGYTAVGEFHYLHHMPGGAPYANRTELSDRIVAAARAVGIAITHLPVFYRFSGFGEIPALSEQSRFVQSPDDYLAIIANLLNQYEREPNVRIGVAPHSLRAVSEADLHHVLTGVAQMDETVPIHIHIAEQQKEVDECIAWSGAHPVAWLLNHFDVDSRWCLVHATHMDDRETAALAATGAAVGLCPTTEANLGDGIFPARTYLDCNGSFGIGSDSNVSVSPTEELRLLEYGKRLKRKRRNVLADGPGRSTGRGLFSRATSGGAHALGLNAGVIAPGARADMVVLDPEHPRLTGRKDDAILDAWIFASAGNPVRDVYVGGKKVIEDGHHANEGAIAATFRDAISRLT